MGQNVGVEVDPPFVAPVAPPPAGPPSPTAAVVTPEAVPLELAPAGIGSRFLALGIDWSVQAALSLALLLGLTPLLDDATSGVGLAVLLVLGTLVIFGYPVVLETLWRGRTIGKAALGLRVVTVEGGQVGLRHALIRAALGVIDFAATTGSAALISALATRRVQRLGDLAAGTLVLRERSALRAPDAVAFGAPPGLEAYASSLDVSALAPEDYLAVRSFLLRARGLRPQARYSLAVALATPLAARLRPSPPPNTPPEGFLLAVASAYQTRSKAARPPTPPTQAAPPSPPPTQPASPNPAAPPLGPAAPPPPPAAEPPPPGTAGAPPGRPADGSAGGVPEGGFAPPG